MLGKAPDHRTDDARAQVFTRLRTERGENAPLKNPPRKNAFRCDAGKSGVNAYNFHLAEFVIMLLHAVLEKQSQTSPLYFLSPTSAPRLPGLFGTFSS